MTVSLFGISISSHPTPKPITKTSVPSVHSRGVIVWSTSEQSRNLSFFQRDIADQTSQCGCWPSVAMLSQPLQWHLVCHKSSLEVSSTAFLSVIYFKCWKEWVIKLLSDFSILGKLLSTWVSGCFLCFIHYSLKNDHIWPILNYVFLKQ